MPPARPPNLLHGFEETGIAGPLAHWIEELAHSAGEVAGMAGPIAEWLTTALAGAVMGLIVGGILVLIVRRFTKRPEDLIVD
jgi:predicted DNA repair protein MutK